MNNKLTNWRRLARALGAPMLAAASLIPLQAATFNNNFNTDPSAVVSLAGSALWTDVGDGTGYISITEAANSLAGGATIADIDNLEAVGGFTLTFKLQIGPGSGNAADGFSVNWGTDVGATPSEEGLGTGLIVYWDIYDNGGGEAPALGVKVGGVTIAEKKMTKAEIMTTGFADVTIRYIGGLLDVDFKGASVFASLPAGIAPQNGASFTFGARTGGENAAQYIDDVNIVTVPPTVPTITAVRSSAKGLSVGLVDAPGATVDVATVTATIDGAAVSGSATKTGDTTTYSFTNPGVYAAGSTHAVVLTYQYGSPAQTANTPLSFTVGAYSTLPPSAALPAGTVDPAKRGFVFRVHQITGPAAANSTQRTEDQLAGLLGDNIADPAAFNGADAAALPPSPSTAPIAFDVSTVINYTDGAETGRFLGDTMFPGIPGLEGGNESIAGEVIAGIEFPAPGVYTIVVNSDDGFVTTAGLNPRSVANPVLGFFQGGRGPADSPFDVYVEAAGIYPFRTIWEEGGGGAALEIYSQLLDGTRLLVNDTATDARALKAYRLPASAFPAYIASLSPGPGSSSIARPKTIEAILNDGTTTVTDGSITLTLNGAATPIIATRTGTQTKAVATPAGLLGSTDYTAVLTYSDNTGSHSATWTFRTGPLSSSLFVIEAEDWDYSDDDITGGLYNPQKGVEGLDVDVMPYFGGAYQDKSAVLNVDYFGNDGGDGSVYRTENGFGDGNDVSMYRNEGNVGGNGLGGNLPVAGNDRGTYKATVSYSLGWSGGDWYNFTRQFPDNGTGGWWEVYMGTSYGGTGDGQLSHALSLVTEGAGTATQTLESLGTFSGPGSGAWAQNNLVPMRTGSGTKAVVKLLGLKTIRATISSGDWDFIIFSAANPPPPSIDQTPLDSAKRDAVIFDWTLKDGGSLVNPATVNIKLNNVDVTSSAVVTKTATGASIHLDLSASLQAAGQIPWTISFQDNSPTPQTVTGSGTVVINPYPTPGVFIIEAEDFNYSSDDIAGGLTNPQAGVPDLDVNVMPYLGGAYNGLSSIKGVDYNNADDNSSNQYRTELDANGENEINISDNNGGRYGQDRGVFTTTSNYKIGWTGGGDWANYTRNFPANDYTVWAALSFDGRGAGQLRGSLDQVTSDPTKTPQTITALGTFDAPGSAGWSRNELVPMKVGGVIATINLSGVKTVRFNMPSGDFDYLVFVPQSTPPPKPEFTSIVRNANGTITLTWTGAGTLQASGSLDVGTTWTDVTGATSPYTFTPTAAMLFGRIRQ